MMSPSEVVQDPVRRRNPWASALAACLVVCLSVASASAQPTPEQNAAAFAAAAAITRQSFHWDSVSGGVPQVATTPRVPLPGTTLTTLAWNPSDPRFYQVKSIDAVDVECTLVATFTAPFATWTAPRGTITSLAFTQGGTTRFIMPWVTAGNSLRDYLRSLYFTGSTVPSPLDAQRRIEQAVGLPTTDGTTSGLALFWVPLANLARPAYAADIATPLPTLQTYADGSYRAVTAGAPSGFVYLDQSDPTTTYDALSDFVEWNQAETTYPWTAMGYTYNWNALQGDRTNAAFGYDPLAPSTPFGVSEFIVSAGTKIVNEGFVTNAQLGFWVVPEIDPNGTGIVFALLLAVVGLVERHRLIAD